MLGFVQRLLVFVLVLLAVSSFFEESVNADCFFKECVPLVTDCGWLKSCKDFCCQIDLGK